VHFGYFSSVISEGPQPAPTLGARLPHGMVARCGDDNDVIACKVKALRRDDNKYSHSKLSYFYVYEKILSRCPHRQPHCCRTIGIQQPKLCGIVIAASYQQRQSRVKGYSGNTALVPLVAIHVASVPLELTSHIFGVLS
jgi:hypothetical protein